MPTRSLTLTDASYRFGFNGKEKDNDGEWGNSTHYDYGFRIYDPSIARFLSVDPLTKSYPWYTPYQFAGNMPTQAIDLDGLEPVVEKGILIGYNVQKGQGPTQIQADISDPITQKQYGYKLNQSVNWTDLVYNNIELFSNVIHSTGNVSDNFNDDYRSGNIKPGDFLAIRNGAPPVKESLPEPAPEPEPITDGGGGFGIRDIWNSPPARALIPDYISIGTGFSSIFGTGSSTSFEANWVTRGDEADWKPMVTTTIGAGVGFDVDYSILSIGGANYLGPVSGITRDRIPTDFRNGDGATLYGSGAATFLGANFSIGADYTPSSKVLGRSVDIGIGLSPGPIPFSGSTGVRNTYKIHDFAKPKESEKQP